MHHCRGPTAAKLQQRLPASRRFRNYLRLSARASHVSASPENAPRLFLLPPSSPHFVSPQLAHTPPVFFAPPKRSISNHLQENPQCVSIAWPSKESANPTLEYYDPCLISSEPCSIACYPILVLHVRLGGHKFLGLVANVFCSIPSSR